MIILDCTRTSSFFYFSFCTEVFYCILSSPLPSVSLSSYSSPRRPPAAAAPNDGRLRLLHELLAGVRVVKFYAWEALFATRIVRQREEQLKALWARSLWATLTNAIALVTPPRPGIVCG